MGLAPSSHRAKAWSYRSSEVPVPISSAACPLSSSNWAGNTTKRTVHYHIISIGSIGYCTSALQDKAFLTGVREVTLSQKCQYAVRAVFELAKRYGTRPTTIGEIAEAQAIPPRFLELILRQLRQGGFVASRRGIQGGYLLAAQPDRLSVAQIIRFIDGEPIPVKCVGTEKERSTNCPLYRRCPFMNLWIRARDAVSRVYDETSFKDLVDEERAAAGKHLADYCI
jgi:Rrf2 family protein